MSDNVLAEALATLGDDERAFEVDHAPSPDEPWSGLNGPRFEAIPCTPHTV